MKVFDLYENATNPFFQAVDLLTDKKLNLDRIEFLMNRMKREGIASANRGGAIPDPALDGPAEPPADDAVRIDRDSDAVFMFIKERAPIDTILRRITQLTRETYGMDVRFEELLNDAANDDQLPPIIRDRAKQLLGYIDDQRGEWDDDKRWFTTDYRDTDPDKSSHRIKRLNHISGLLGIEYRVVSGQPKSTTYQITAAHERLGSVDSKEGGYAHVLIGTVVVTRETLLRGFD